ncbi:MAG TPA: hypothetical protein VMH50_17175 [Thermoleophilia bacterium]|nr:hypothetical protein [Thermoleophilia bacterium]
MRHVPRRRQLPREVVDLLGDDPELIRLAEHVAALAEAPTQALAGRQQRLLVAAAAAAALGAALVGVVVVLFTGANAPGLSDRALAAIGGDPVLYAVVAQTVSDDRTVELVSGRETPVQLTIEAWLDQETGRLRIVQRRNGGLINDTLGTTQSITRNATPRLDPALALFLTGYRQALRQGRVRDAGTAVVSGHRIRWLILVSGHPAGERVAVDMHSFLPVVIREPDGTRWAVTRIESIPAASVDFRAPGLPSPALSAGRVTAQQASSPRQIAHALGVPPLWLGRSNGALKLIAVRLQRLTSLFPPTAHRAPIRSVGASLTYRNRTGTMLELREARRALPAYSFDGGLTFAFDPIPPHGAMQLTSIGGEWIGQLRTQRLYITITAPDPATVIQAARSLQPISR